MVVVVVVVDSSKDSKDEGLRLEGEEEGEDGGDASCVERMYSVCI